MKIEALAGFYNRTSGTSNAMDDCVKDVDQKRSELYVVFAMNLFEHKSHPVQTICSKIDGVQYNRGKLSVKSRR